jgi:hypothetical protein
MPVSSSVRLTLISTAIVALSACSGGGQFAPSSGATVSLSQGRSLGGSPLAVQARPDTVKDFAFGSDNASGVYEYNRSGQDQAPLQEITDGLKYPYGIWIGDAPSPDLYVADEGNSNVVVFGAPSYTSTTITYQDTGQIPSSVTQCGNYVYAGNLIDNATSYGSATVWKTGKPKPSKVVSNGETWVSAQGIACDPTSGNVYVAFLYSYAGPGGIDEYTPGLGGKPTLLPMSPGYPGGIAVDKKGDIAVTEEFSGTVEFYHPTSSSPFQTVTGFSSPVGVAFEASDSDIWVADQGANKLYRVAVKTSKKLDTITKPGFKALSGAATIPADH